MEITVIIPTYNRYELLQRALHSVYAQTYHAKEVIVVDDGSDDNTAQITQEFPNIRYLFQENSGVASARNLGLQNAQCEWVAFLDSDDEWLGTKLAEQVLFHTQHKDVKMSYTDENWIRKGKALKIPKKFQKIGKDVFLENLSYCNIAPSSVLVHKELFVNVGSFDSSLEVCEDYDLWLRIALHTPVAFIDKKLINKYAGHEGQLSMKHWGMDRFRIVTLEKLLGMEDIQKSRYYKQIRAELLQKYELLLAGAKKHNKKESIVELRKKIDLF